MTSASTAGVKLLDRLHADRVYARIRRSGDASHHRRTWIAANDAERIHVPRCGTIAADDVVHPLAAVAGSPRAGAGALLRSTRAGSRASRLSPAPAGSIDETSRPRACRRQRGSDYVTPAWRASRRRAATSSVRATSHVGTGGRIVLAADTAVVTDSRIMGKPRSDEDAASMLATLSGSVHQVLTGVVVRTDARELVELVTTRVHFLPLSAGRDRLVRRDRRARRKAGRLRDPGPCGPVHRLDRRFLVERRRAAARDREPDAQGSRAWSIDRAGSAEYSEAGLQPVNLYERETYQDRRDRRSS